MSSKIVIFELDGEEYGIAVEEVKEVVKMLDITPIPNSPEALPGFVNLRGAVIPVIDLEKKFNLSRQNEKADQKIVVIDGQTYQFGIIVDIVTEVLDIDTSALQKTPEIINNKIGEEYVKGVIVVKETTEEDEETFETITTLTPTKEDSAEDQRAILIIDSLKLTAGYGKEVTAVQNSQSAGKVKNGK